MNYLETKLNELNGQIKYTEDCLKQEMENWERKEYQCVLNDCTEERSRIEYRIKTLDV